MPIFLSTVHELRHILNFIKGKDAFDLPLPPLISHTQWSNTEEFRTITYSTCCEHAVAQDFKLPLRIAHEGSTILQELSEDYINPAMQSVFTSWIKAMHDIPPFTITPPIISIDATLKIIHSESLSSVSDDEEIWV